MQEKKTSTLDKFKVEDVTTACPVPTCGGAAYWIFGVGIPGWEIPIAGKEEWLCWSSDSLLSAKAKFQSR